jgi:benzoate/toluate 1,2-dioxygenase reductase subunit
MNHTIALQFEDGVTRFISCNPNEKLSDAAYRQKVNIPLDCRDGACGTCRGHCESGQLRYAARQLYRGCAGREGRGRRLVLACQMRPTSDCVVRIPATSSACKTGVHGLPGKIACGGAAVAVDHPLLGGAGQSRRHLDFLPGQYVNVTVPGTDQTRSYSFSSAPGAAQASFVVRNVPNGLMSTYLTAQAQPGQAISLHRPVRQLLSAARAAPHPDAGRRHRDRALPVDAGRACR